MGYDFDWYSAIFTDDEPFLIVVRHSIIFGISLNPEVKSNDAMIPIAGIMNGYDVEFDDSEQFIYWVENPVSFLNNIESIWLVLQEPIHAAVFL